MNRLPIFLSSVFSHSLFTTGDLRFTISPAVLNLEQLAQLFETHRDAIRARCSDATVPPFLGIAVLPFRVLGPYLATSIAHCGKPLYSAASLDDETLENVAGDIRRFEGQG